MTGYKPMDQKIKARWVKQLRSAQFTQGAGALGRGKLHAGEVQYCCLGVLVDKCGIKGKVNARWNAEGFLGVCSTQPGDNHRNEGSLTSQAMEITGLDPEAERVLISLNDNSGSDFNQLADWIEENL